jgi:hypothetical protein
MFRQSSRSLKEVHPEKHEAGAEGAENSHPALMVDDYKVP